MRLQLLLLLCFLIFHFTFAEKECYINVEKGMHRTDPPLVIYPPPHAPGHIYPTVNHPNQLTFQQDEEFLVVCPFGRKQDKNIKIPLVSNIKVNNRSIQSFSTTVKCSRKEAKETFLIKDKFISSFTEISCEKPSAKGIPIMLRPVNRSCHNGLKYEIGYDLGEFGFLKTYEICHDADKPETLWARAIIYPDVVANENRINKTDGRSTHFKIGGLYGGIQRKDDPYNLKKNDDMFKKMGKENWTSPNRDHRKYLAKGHLIARADMIFLREQDSTYLYENAVPMWQKIKAEPGNWGFVERLIRNQTKNLKYPLVVYAGGLRKLRINGQFIYLHEGKKIPVPEVLFKCMLDHNKKQGLCFLVVNNPYTEEKPSISCKKSLACRQYFQKFDKARHGLTYCCSLSDFYNVTVEDLGNEFKAFKHYEEMNY